MMSGFVEPIINNPQTRYRSKESLMYYVYSHLLVWDTHLSLQRLLHVVPNLISSVHCQ